MTIHRLRVIGWYAEKDQENAVKPRTLETQYFLSITKAKLNYLYDRRMAYDMTHHPKETTTRWGPAAKSYEVMIDDLTLTQYLFKKLLPRTKTTGA